VQKIIIIVDQYHRSNQHHVLITARQLMHSNSSASPYWVDARLTPGHGGCPFLWHQEHEGRNSTRYRAPDWQMAKNAHGHLMHQGELGRASAPNPIGSVIAPATP